MFMDGTEFTVWLDNLLLSDLADIVKMAPPTDPIRRYIRISLGDQLGALVLRTAML